MLISRLNPLVDRINALNVRLKAFNVTQALGNCQEKLNKWRNTCHTMIDCLYEQKCQELNQHVTEKIERQQEAISTLQSRMSEMVQEQEATRPDITFVTAAVHDLEKEMTNIEEIVFSVETQPLTVDGSFICIKGSNRNQLDLTGLSIPYKRLDCSKESSAVLASNGPFLLTHAEPNLYLINQELTVEKRDVWSYGRIYSICWSSTLAQFVVISAENVFLVDDKTLLSEVVQIDQNQKWGSCACSEANLYITTWESGSSIFVFSLSSSIQFLKEWKSPTTCSQQEIIHGIAYNRSTLALLIKDKATKIIHMELRSTKTLERLWLCQLNIKSSHFFKFHCCRLNRNDWLVSDHENEELLHVTKDGKLEKMYTYNQRPRCALLFGSHIIAVSTEKSVNFHKV